MPAAAVTDRGTLAGIGEFYRAARDEGIKPVIGLELTRPATGIHDLG
jgi:DNA polymerase-3 subunit alpha